jgi:hypothetical protein
MVITHPAPLLVLLGFVACEIGLRAFNEVDFRRRKGRSTSAKLAFVKTDLCFVLISCLLASYVLLFVDKNRTSENLQNTVFERAGRIDFIRLHALGLTSGNNISRLYRFAFYPLLLVVFSVALRGFVKRWRESRLTRGDLFAVTINRIFS